MYIKKLDIRMGTQQWFGKMPSLWSHRVRTYSEADRSGGDPVCLPAVMQCFRVELQDNAGTGEASTVCKGPGQDRTSRAGREEDFFKNQWNDVEN